MARHRRCHVTAPLSPRYRDHGPFEWLWLRIRRATGTAIT